MSHPPIPEADFKPPWHQYFVKLKDYITSYFTATDARLDAIEAQHELDAAAAAEEEEDFPVDTIMMLAFDAGITLTAGEQVTASGANLLMPTLYTSGSSVLYVLGPAVGVGTWRLVGPPLTTGYKAPYHYYMFKRIS